MLKLVGATPIVYINKKYRFEIIDYQLFFTFFVIQSSYSLLFSEVLNYSLGLLFLLSISNPAHNLSLCLLL